MDTLRKKLKISEERLKETNDFLLAKDNPLTNNLLEVIEKYGGVDEINRKAKEAGKLENLMAHLEKKKSPFFRRLEVALQVVDYNAYWVTAAT